MEEKRDKPYFIVYGGLYGTREFYSKEAYYRLLDVLDGPSGRLQDNFNMHTLVVPGRPKGKRILEARPHRIDPLENDMPDVYVSHIVPIEELIYAKSYWELFRTLENKYHLERTTDEEGNICYITDDEYTPQEEFKQYLDSHGMEVRDGKIVELEGVSNGGDD